MSTLYLVDFFATPLATAKIIDVRQALTAPLSGNFVVRVPDFISVQNPIDVSDLITKKYLGLLAFYAGYANVAYDDLFDLLDVDTGAAQVAGSFGERNLVTIYPGARFQTQPVTLAGPAPSQAFITWETYSVSVSDPAEDRVVPSYVEEPSSTTTFTCDVSFNNGANFYAATDGGLVNIPPLGQGTQFILRLTNATSPPRSLRVGSWAVIY